MNVNIHYVVQIKIFNQIEKKKRNKENHGLSEGGLGSWGEPPPKRRAVVLFFFIFCFLFFNLIRAA
jgi:hypothetical protein